MPIITESRCKQLTITKKELMLLVGVLLATSGCQDIRQRLGMMKGKKKLDKMVLVPGLNR